MVLGGLGLVSCSAKDESVNFDELPATAQNFINTYFADSRVEECNYDNEDREYELKLANGFEVTFNEAGEWISVDAPKGKSLPSGIALPAIVSYVASNYPDAGINEIEKTKYGFDVDLTNDVDLGFYPDGKFIGKDTATNNTAPSNELPETAKNFINSNFGNNTYTSQYDSAENEYEVTLTNGYQLTFDTAGNWTDVDAPYGKTVPDGIVPATIAKYIKTNYASYGVNEIEKTSYGYQVDLTNEVELRFNADGGYLGMSD